MAKTFIWGSAAVFSRGHCQSRIESPIAIVKSELIGVVVKIPDRVRERVQELVPERIVEPFVPPSQLACGE